MIYLFTLMWKTYKISIILTLRIHCSSVSSVKWIQLVYACIVLFRGESSFQRCLLSTILWWMERRWNQRESCRACQREAPALPDAERVFTPNGIQSRAIIDRQTDKMRWRRNRFGQTVWRCQFARRWTQRN